MPYILDILVIALIALCVIIAYKRGFVITVFNFFSLLISFILAQLLYPSVSVFLRGTAVFTSCKESIAKSLNLDGLASSLTHAAEAEAIQGLPLPDFIKKALLENNNSLAHQALDVSGFADYISGYLAGLVMNALAMLVVFALVFILMRVLSVLLKILTKLPVLHSLNKLLGVLVGLAQGVLLVWIVLAVLVGLFAANQTFPVGELLPASILAKWFHENNLVLNLLMKVFG